MVFIMRPDDRAFLLTVATRTTVLTDLTSSIRELREPAGPTRGLPSRDRRALANSNVGAGPVYDNPATMPGFHRN